jgi:2-isopropylmalate synthase
LGFHLNGEQLQTVFDQFKRLADKKKEIYDGDITAIIEQQLHGLPDAEWSLVHYDVQSRTDHAPLVRLTLRRGDEELTAESDQGDGPIDAAFWACEKITGIKMVCKDFQARSATIGRDALGEASIEVEHNGTTYRGRGVSTDTVEATVLALLNAVNRIVHAR